MADNSKKSPTKSSRASSSSSRGPASDRFPIDNVTYDLITVIHVKAKGLEALDRYLQDAADDEDCRSLFEEIREQDQEAIAQLRDALRDRLDSQAEAEEAA